MGWEDVPSLQNCTWVSEDFPFGIYCTIPPSSCLYRSPPAGRVKMRVRAVRSHVSQVESIRLVGEQPVCKPPAHSHNGSPSIFVFLLFGVYCPPAFCCQDCTSFMSIEEFRRKVNRENSTFSSQSVTVSGGSLLRQKTYLYHWLLSHNSLKTFLLLQFLTLTVWRQLAVGQIRICKFSSTQNICFIPMSKCMQVHWSWLCQEMLVWLGLRRDKNLKITKQIQKQQIWCSLKHPCWFLPASACIDPQRTPCISTPQQTTLDFHVWKSPGVCFGHQCYTVTESPVHKVFGQQVNRNIKRWCTQRVMSQSEFRFPSPEIKGYQKVTSFGVFPLKGVKTEVTCNSVTRDATSQAALKTFHLSRFVCLFRFTFVFN